MVSERVLCSTLRYRHRPIALSAICLARQKLVILVSVDDRYQMHNDNV